MTLKSSFCNILAVSLVFLAGCASPADPAAADKSESVTTSQANKGGASPVTPPKRSSTPEPQVTTSQANKGGSSPVTPPPKSQTGGWSMFSAVSATQNVTLVSIPAGAAVTINGQGAGNAPVTSAFDPSKTYTVTFILPGYSVETVPVSAVSIASGSYLSAKGGAPSSFNGRFPTEIKATLQPIPDRYAALQTAVSALDEQLKKGEITPAQHKQLVEDAVKHLSQ